MFRHDNYAGSVYPRPSFNLARPASRLRPYLSSSSLFSPSPSVFFFFFTLVTSQYIKFNTKSYNSSLWRCRRESSPLRNVRGFGAKRRREKRGIRSANSSVMIASINRNPVRSLSAFCPCVVKSTRGDRPARYTSNSRNVIQHSYISSSSIPLSLSPPFAE